jgi:hypothetical protein
MMESSGVSDGKLARLSAYDEKLVWDWCNSTARGATRAACAAGL